MPERVKGCSAELGIAIVVDIEKVDARDGVVFELNRWIK